MAEGATSDLGQVAEWGAFADPHHPCLVGGGWASVPFGVVGAAGDGADRSGLGVAGQATLVSAFWLPRRLPRAGTVDGEHRHPHATGNRTTA